jgi:mannosyltransferase OCH1-like enzyme
MEIINEQCKKNFPKKIHITCKNKDTFDDKQIWKECYLKWKQTHSDYDIKIYDDNDIHEIIIKHFPEDIDTIKQIRIGAMLADCFRYLILYLEGGIYADADVEPLKHIDEIFTNTNYCGNNNTDFFIYPENLSLITKTWDFYKNPCDHCKYIETKQNDVIQYKCLGHRMQQNTNIILGKEYFEEPQFYNSNINNTRLAQLFMISKPKQQIFLECYKKCINNIRNRHDDIIQITDKEEYLKQVLLTTGPIFFTKMINNILPNENIYILPSDRFCSGSGSIVPITKNSFISHHYSASWINDRDWILSLPNDCKSTICFATMCKNEEHCILETLESCYRFCNYWIVCDTGSTDNTCELITNFFKEKNIPGELFHDEWVGFGHNKTLMFERCYKKTDYIIHPDADDLIIGNFDFTENDYGKLAYNIRIKRGSTEYTGTAIWNNNYHWKICGNAHTIARCLDNDGLEYGDLTHKEFYLLSRDTGSRSNDPEKYYKDALILQKQFIDTALFDEDGLNSRSVFYTAQSFYDSGKMEDAMKWYMIYTKLNNTWNEEIFESYMRISDCMISIQYEEKYIVGYLNRAIELFRDRAEPYYRLGKYYYSNKKHKLAYLNFKICQNKNFKDICHKYSLFMDPYVYGNYVDEILLSL